MTREQKIPLINDNSRGNGLSIAKLAEKYAISKSSVANILTHSAEYQDAYSFNVNKGVKRKLKDGSGGDIDEVLFEWFMVQRAKHIPTSGSMLQEKTREIFEEMDNMPGEFKASNGRLQMFCNRHMIGFRQSLSESASIITATTIELKYRLPTIVNEYNDDDVYNVDETALSFKAIPARSLVLRKEDCKGGKHPREPYTVLFCSNWSRSDKPKSLAIGKILDITSSDYSR